jgi:hypothetical protein
LLNAEKINSLLKHSDYHENNVIQEINRIIRHMDISEQMELHNALSNEAIEKIYPMLNQLSLHDHAKEHVIWSYFSRKICETGSLTDDLFQEMFKCYSKHQLLAIESLIIEMLKNDFLSTNQLGIAEKVFTGKAFIKEAAAFKCRHKVRTGNLLNEADVSALLQLGAYSTLEFALDKCAITADGLNQIVEPGHMEKDRKKKLALFKKASKYRMK